nr:hypothetical protein CFP56_29239 [Quercus suber]
MPLRKKVTGVLSGSGDNQQAGLKVEYISMHTEGIESSGPRGSPYLTKEDIFAMLFETKKAESTVYSDTRPFYSKEVAGKPYPATYTPPIFPKYDDMVGNAKEYIKRYVDALTSHSYDHELRLKEFSKSLEGCAFTWREGKKVEVVVVKELKKAAKGKKRERGSIPPHFTVSTEELYRILEAWLKNGVVVLSECKRESIDEENRGPLYCRIAKGDLVIKGHRPLARREVAQALTRVVERNHEVAADEGSLIILPFNPIALQGEEEDDGEVVESEKPSKIRRTTRLDAEELVKEAPEYMNALSKMCKRNLLRLI